MATFQNEPLRLEEAELPPAVQLFNDVVRLLSPHSDEDISSAMSLAHVFFKKRRCSNLPSVSPPVKAMRPSTSSQAQQEVKRRPRIVKSAKCAEYRLRQKTRKSLQRATNALRKLDKNSPFIAVMQSQVKQLEDLSFQDRANLRQSNSAPSNSSPDLVLVQEVNESIPSAPPFLSCVPTAPPLRANLETKSRHLPLHGKKRPSDQNPFGFASGFLTSHKDKKRKEVGDTKSSDSHLG
jgi:hypothetical protein